MIDSDSNRILIIKNFPLLKDDISFKIAGKATPNYNCIAWAAHVTDSFWSALPKNERPKIINGVKIDWPFDVDNEFSIKTLTEIFRHLGYEKCNNGDYENHYKKIALYENEDGATHAARQLTADKYKGVWSSKLGSSFLIHHGTAYTIESKAYGKVACFLKKSMK